MRLANVILDLGRVVAYYPGLRRVTGSVNASILLCQFLYWYGKGTSGWIYKTSDEIEEETGLTYNEQTTARKNLVERGILVEEFKRLDHTLRYKLNVNILNDLWEKEIGKESQVVEEPQETPEEYFAKLQAEKPAPPEKDMSKYDKKEERNYITDLVNSPAARKAKKLAEIQEKIEKKLHIIADNKRWKAFIDFAYKREEKNGEPIDDFLQWAIQEGFNPVYWTPEKMITLYPQAFIKPEPVEPSKDFVTKLPEIKEEEYAPMPRGLGKKK